MSATENEELNKIVEELPPKRQNISTITIPTKRARTEKQIAWSKQLGQKSQEFKKRKQKLLSGQAPKMTQPIPVTAEPEPSEAAETVGPAETGVNKPDNKLWLLVPVTFGIGLLIVWVKWGKYKVFKMFQEAEKPNDTIIGDTRVGDTRIGDTRIGYTRIGDTKPKCKIIAME